MISTILRRYDNMSISKKITLICSIFFILLIALINVVMFIGISRALLYPAEATIKHGVKSLNEILETSTNEIDDKFFQSLKKILVAGVVLKVYEDDKIIFDTNTELYPTNEDFEKNIIQDRPLLSDQNLDIAKLKNALVYRAEINFNRGGKEYHFYFYRTITSQTNIFHKLKIFMLTVDFISVIFAITAGYIISRKVLKPLKTMTELAKKITLNSERDSVKERIPIPPADDEMSELAKTFNEMLNFMQNDITKYKNFVSDVSHELKNSLMVIEHYSKFLKYDDPALHNESVIVIREEAQNMNKMIAHLRSLTKNDDNTLQLNKENFNLAEVVDVAFQRAKTTTNHHEIILIQNDTAQIFGDKAAFLQMLRIFIDNAIKYTPEGGKIKINSVKRGDKIFVSVADTGIGIAEENFDKIFERGVRITEDKFVEKVEGSGIGLDMAKKIADGHDIKIDVESKVGEGSTFKLKIPTVQEKNLVSP